MFAFKLWSNFGAFRDPLTITQNLTLPIPPKTTIGGILASVLGIDYNDYLKDSEYFDFVYSLVLDKDSVIRKKSFCQNYIEDYTKNAELKYNAINDLVENETDLQEVINQINDIPEVESTEYKKLNKKFLKFYDDILGKMQKPKPIYRELLISPSYFVFINNYKYEKEIIDIMKKHYSSFLLYMGNSEFPANYELLELLKSERTSLKNVNSFTQNLDKIIFEPERKYTTVYFATKSTGGKIGNELHREYRDYKKIVISNNYISFFKPISGYNIKLQDSEFNCEFI